MAGYLIYIPRAQGASPDNLRRVGLELLIDTGVSLESCDVLERGPDGGYGVLYSWPTAGQPPAKVDLASQDWTPQKGPQPCFWMGKANGEIVTPESILRSNHLGGTPVRLDDGQEWLIPAARRLPHRLTMDESGRPVRKVKTQYQEFYDRTEEYYSQLINHEFGADIAFADAWTFAVQSLAMNYRVNAEIVDWLELLSDDNILQLIGATFEWTTIQQMDRMHEVQKKTD